MKIFGRDRPLAAAIERELSATAATLGGHLHHAPSDYAGPIPAPWEPVLAARSASERVRHALAMWAQLAPQLPESRSLLSQHCRDVRLCSLHGAPALAYVITHAEAIHVVVAEAPAGPRVDPPEAWATVPELLRTFLSEVHGSLTDRWNTATIPVAPEEMESLDTWGHGAFDPEHLVHAGLDLTPDELTLFVDASGTGRYLCISPRLPGEVLWWDIYEGVEVADLWGAVDGTLATLLQPR